MVGVAANVLLVVEVAVEVAASTPLYTESVLQVLWWQLEKFCIGNGLVAINTDDGTLPDKGVVVEVGRLLGLHPLLCSPTP